MRQSHRLIFNTAIIWVTRVLAVFAQLIILPFVLHRLGEEQYGIYILAWSLLQVLELAQRGMSSALIKYGSAYLAQDRIDDMNRVVGTATVYSFFVGLAGCCGIIIWTRCFSHHVVVVGAEQSDVALFCFTTIGIMALIVFPMSPFRGLLYAKQRHDLVAIADVASQYLKLGLVVLWFVVVGHSLESLMVISAGTMIAANLLMILLAYQQQPDLKNDWTKCNWHTFKMLFCFGGVIFLCTLCLMLRETGLKWVMGGLVSMSFVTHMAIMIIPIGMFREIVQAMTLAVMPAASKYNAQENREILGELLLRGTRYIVLVALGALITAFLLLKPLLVLWLGDEYAFLGNYMLILFGASAFSMTTSCAHHILKGIGELKIILINSIVGHAVLPVSITVLAFMVLEQGYWAVVLGLSISNVVYGLMQLSFCARAIGVSHRTFLTRGYAQALYIALPMFSILIGTVEYFELESMQILLTGTILTLIVSGVLFHVFFFTEPEKELSRRIRKEIVGRIPFVHVVSVKQK